jgi:hypothetical protein
MDRADLIRLYPRLFHMAEPTAWPLIQEHGLRSTSALLDLFDVREPRRSQLLREHRPASVPVEHPVHGSAVVRDQIPLHLRKLAACLDSDTTVPEFLGLLNERVFFWLQERRLERLLAARAYRDRDHLVITVDTENLLDHVGDHAVTLSRINSGATVFKAAGRGKSLFKSISDYSHPPRERPSASASDVAELCVNGLVPDITAVAIKAELRGPSGTRLLWQSS